MTKIKDTNYFKEKIHKTSFIEEENGCEAVDLLFIEASSLSQASKAATAFLNQVSCLKKHISLNLSSVADPHQIVADPDLGTPLFGSRS